MRTTGAPELVVTQVRREVGKLDKDLPLANIAPMEDYVRQARSESSFITVLSGTLAGIALLLACIGVYGVAACSVVQRTCEFGIRMAVGGRASDVMKLVLRQSMLPVILGGLIGVALAVVLAPLLSKLLFGVRPIDPTTPAAALMILCGSGLLACYLPARRATKVDPMVALRYE